MTTKNILVIGSVSIDNVIYTDELPKGGTTVFGTKFISNVGGKGANQAIAIKRLGGEVNYIGAIGNDEEGLRIERFLKENALNSTLLKKKENTGIASITIDNKTAENRIIIIPGANLSLSKKDIDDNIDKFKNASYLLIQLETPIETVCYALKLAKKLNMTTILNPAPYKALPEDIFPYIDYFIPNEHEIDGYVLDAIDDEIEKGKYMLAKGVKNVIITLGSRGALLVNKDKEILFTAKKVKAVDTTAAGDSFVGTFVNELNKNKSIEKAIEFAIKASAITVTKRGAIQSLPTKEEVDKII